MIICVRIKAYLYPTIFANNKTTLNKTKDNFFLIASGYKANILKKEGYSKPYGFNNFSAKVLSPLKTVIK